jgi:hypothetical protein
VRPLNRADPQQQLERFDLRRVRPRTILTVTAANINASYADIGTNIAGNRTMQKGLKLYF